MAEKYKQTKKNLLFFGATFLIFNSINLRIEPKKDHLVNNLYFFFVSKTCIFDSKVFCQVRRCFIKFRMKTTRFKNVNIFQTLHDVFIFKCKLFYPDQWHFNILGRK